MFPIVESREHCLESPFFCSIFASLFPADFRGGYLVKMKSRKLFYSKYGMNMTYEVSQAKGDMKSVSRWIGLTFTINPCTVFCNMFFSRLCLYSYIR